MEKRRMKRIARTKEQAEQLLIENAKKVLNADTLYSKTQLCKLLHHLSTHKIHPVHEVVDLLIKLKIIMEHPKNTGMKYSLILEGERMTELRELELRRLEKFKETAWLTRNNKE